MPADTPTIVFVHGAWADASGFGESIRALRDRGFATIGFANRWRRPSDRGAAPGRPRPRALGTQDRAIPPAGQRFMAERGNARIEEVAASHASMVSQPEAVTQLILSAVKETSSSRT